MFDYKVSIITAVYNIAPFLRETIDSILEQDIGFENIQLILVNDGSLDESGAICDEYAKKYPNNITVVHKENGGVSSARNEGLKYVKGEYVNFLDGDDTLSPNTVSSVCSFFELHKDETDVVALPIHFFDGIEGEHILNYKFLYGSRVIDLNSEYDAPQLSIASAFIKSDVMLQHTFDTHLAYAEDAKVLIRILSKRFTLGVVEDAKYMYRRRRVGEGSAIQTGIYREKWYLPYMQHFQLESIEYCMETLAHIPSFVQYTLMYDLQWRVTLAEIPEGVITEDVKTEFFRIVHQVLQNIDDKIILKQKNLRPEDVFFTFLLKNGKSPNVQTFETDIHFVLKWNRVFKASKFPLFLEFLSFDDHTFCIEGSLIAPAYSWDTLQLICYVNDIPYHVPFESSSSYTTRLGHEILREHLFKISLPLSIQTTNTIRFALKINETVVSSPKLLRKSFFPFTDMVPSGYVKIGKWVAQNSPGGLSITHIDHVKLNQLENQFCHDLLALKDYPRQKAVAVRRIAKFISKHKRKPIWIITDRVDRAGDNGEAFFRYMQKEHPEIISVFAINKSSPDYAAMKQIGPVVSVDSFQYKVLALICDCIVSSQAEEYFANPFTYENFTYHDITSTKKYIFLQHGIIKDDLSGWLQKRNKNLQAFVTTTYPEYRSILEYPYGYTEKEVWLTGIPRFDRLYHDEQNIITFMPTWRRYLVSHFDRSTGKWQPIPDFTESEFYRFYSQLFTHPKLLDTAKKHGYSLQVLLHPNLAVYRDLFAETTNVHFLEEDTEYRKVFAETNLLVTDYSSTAFDFAYLRKPVLYTHFDSETFFGGTHSYTKGYFDYERDGLGEVEYDLDTTVNRLVEYIENDCFLKDQYRDRINNFFMFDDQNNCKRVFEKIISMES